MPSLSSTLAASRTTVSFVPRLLAAWCMACVGVVAALPTTSSSLSTVQPSEIVTTFTGSPLSLGFRVGYHLLANSSVAVSPWHDVDLFPTRAAAAAAAEAIVAAATATTTNSDSTKEGATAKRPCSLARPHPLLPSLDPGQGPSSADATLLASRIIYTVVENPAGTHAKHELDTRALNNPVRTDVTTVNPAPKP